MFWKSGLHDRPVSWADSPGPGLRGFGALVGVDLGTAGAASNAPRFPWFHPECWANFQFPGNPASTTPQLLGSFRRPSPLGWSGAFGWVSLGTAGAASNAPRFPGFYPECWANFQFLEIQ